MTMHWKAAILTVLLLAAGGRSTVSAATPPASAKNQGDSKTELRSLKLKIPERGLLTMKFPDKWKQNIREQPPTVILSPDEGDEFKVLITPLWSKTNDPAFSNAESVKRTIDVQLSSMLPGAVEEKVEITEFKGVDGPGYYFLVTDNAPKPGEYPYAVSSVLGVGKLMLVSTILCRSKDTIGIAEVVKALQSARHEIDKMETMKMDELTKLANDGNPQAQNELGRRNGVGEGTAVDSKASAMWYEKAANQGLAQGQANLAYMYYEGEGVEKDLGKALEWYKKAATQGNFMAQHMLGYMFITGTGVTKSGKDAEKWFTLAANQGYVGSQGALSKMYRDGDGIEKDAAKAAMWLKRVTDARTYGNVWKDEAHQDR